MAFWFNGRNSLKKTQYYVWYLGSKECDGLRGSEFVLPAMRQLLKESFRRFPNKVTVQVSAKGLKLIQTMPTFGKKSGKLKMEVTKFQIGVNSMTFSTVGPPPFNDIVACIVLVFNPETKSPVHVHCYRCDSAETALLMDANIKNLLNKPDQQKHIDLLEHRLLVSGLLLPKRNSIRDPLSPAEFLSSRHLDRSVAFGAASKQTDENDLDKSSSPLFMKSDDFEYVGMSSDEENKTSSSSERAAKMKKDLFRELRNKLKAEKSYAVQSSPDCGQWHFQKRRSYAPEHRDDHLVSSSPESDWKKAAAQEGSHTSSTSGFGSDLSSSGNRGRYRFSIAELPSWLGSDRDLTGSPPMRAQPAVVRSPELPPRQRYQKTEKAADAGKMFRMFGDTLVLKDQKLGIATGAEKSSNLPPRYRSCEQSSRLEKARLCRSMDNLAFECNSVAPMPEPTSRPLARSRNQKNDGFWRDRARRNSWFLPSAGGAMFP